MSHKRQNFFWISYSDLMTSLFFIVLALFFITFVNLRKNEKKLKKNEKLLQEKVENLQQKLEIYNIVEENLKPLKEHHELFNYEEKYKRFVLSFDVQFKVNKYGINQKSLYAYSNTKKNIISAGDTLKATIDKLLIEKRHNEKMKNVSYLLIISGYASHLKGGSKRHNYELSYRRAYSLWSFWVSQGINLEQPKYKDLIDLQIAGNGWGGIGRWEYDPFNDYTNESKNQRFIIQIIPKVKNTEKEKQK